ncbi:MAG: hypothetical protein JWN56_2469 [Sphingobacteriales bacterium]|nr:hypothetical protein [Sphingobacteriales bacterium]
MKASIGIILISGIMMSCGTSSTKKAEQTTPKPIVGTWKMISSTLVEKGDTTNTEFSKDQSFIKIINDSHFAFLQHDLRKGKDSTAVYSSGGGTYALDGNTYTEHLEYCSAREWEGNDFKFTLMLKGDTLIQKGIEVVESAGVNRENTERYIRMKN